MQKHFFRGYSFYKGTEGMRGLHRALGAWCRFGHLSCFFRSLYFCVVGIWNVQILHIIFSDGGAGGQDETFEVAGFRQVKSCGVVG